MEADVVQLGVATVVMVATPPLSILINSSSCQ